jgi:hypothetical protein
MYARTGDPKWLQPRAAKATATGVDVEQTTAVPDPAKGQALQDKYAKLKELNLEYSLQVARKTWPSITSENSNTDRIAMPGLNAIVELLTGGNLEYGLSHIPMTLKNTSREVAFMNLVSSEKLVRTIFYNFNSKTETAGLVLWGLQVGAGHEVKVGIDKNDDDEIDEVLRTFKYTHAHRGDSIECTLPPRKAVIVEVRQTSPGAGMPKRAVDLALSPWDLRCEDGKIQATVHNIGNQNAGPFTVTIREGPAGKGKVLKTFEVPGLEAPNDMEPRSVTVSVGWNLPAGATKERPFNLSVEVNCNDGAYEVTQRNNAATAAFPRERPSYMTPRMWKSLAAPRGLKQWDPFPPDFPKSEIR